MEQSNKRGVTDSVGGVATKRRRNDNSHVLGDLGYRNLYMAGRTKKGSDEEDSFQLILQGKKIKDVSWMYELDSTSRELSYDESGRCAYILYHDGKLKQWGKDQAKWHNVPHVSRKITVIPFLVNVAQVACSFSHCIAAKCDGSVITWGFDGLGELGRPGVNRAEWNLPGRVDSLNNMKVMSVACSASASFALAHDGKIYSWGYNLQNGLGCTSDDRHVATPALIKDLPAIKQIVACNSIAGALTHEGKVYAWGQNKECGHQTADGNDITRPSLLEGELKDVQCVSIACGTFHMGGVADNGCVYTWGFNGNDQLGRGDDIAGDYGAPGLVKALSDQSISSISLGESHSIALGEDGGVFVWGRVTIEDEGLGLPDKQNYSSPQMLSRPFPGKVSNAIANEDFTAILIKSHPDEFIYSSHLNVPMLFNNPGSHPDMEFTLEGKTICYAHKNIVCQCSKYFDIMFKNNMKESNQRLFPVHYSEDVLLSVMKFIYGADIESLDPRFTPELYEAADLYCLEGLKDWCCDTLGKGLNLGNVGFILQGAFDRKLHLLEDICMEFMVQKGKEWSKSSNKDQITSPELWSKICEALLEPY